MDGIVWTAVGTALVVHAGFIVSLGWIGGEASAPSSLGAAVLRALVAFAFACVGGAALYLGVRRFRSDAPRS
jgi:hypothetical protein